MAAAHLMSHDDELIARVRAGDESAFEELFREHYNGMCVFAARIVGSDSAAEDVVHDVLLAIWRRHARWTLTGSLPSYLYASVRNQALNHVRRARHDKRWRAPAEIEADLLDERAHESRSDDQLRSDELAVAIDRAIGELTPRCRQAFLLRRQHHLSYAEIARTMEIAPKTVEVQIGIALKSLRKKLAEWL